MNNKGRYLYVFLDEAGNLDFSPKGTRYFCLTSIAKQRPFPSYEELVTLRYDLIEMGLDIERFHASDDRQAVRNHVFKIIAQHLSNMRIDSVIVEKRKTGPALRADTQFYPRMLGYLLRFVIGQFHLPAYDEVIVFTDAIPVQNKRRAVEKAVKQTLAAELPQEARYRVLHHRSMSNVQLQIADYCNWAVFRKWERGDDRAYSVIAPAVRSTFDIFRSGNRFYY